LQELSISRPFNDQCGTAQRLQSGELITGASSGAWPHGLVNHACSLQARSRGLFYSIEGTGDGITLSLRPDISEGKLEVASALQAVISLRPKTPKIPFAFLQSRMKSTQLLSLAKEFPMMVSFNWV
jgi:hypothetical protein